MKTIKRKLVIVGAILIALFGAIIVAEALQGLACHNSKSVFAGGTRNLHKS